MVAVWTCIFWTGLWKWSVSGSARWGVFARIHWLRGVRRTPSNLLSWGQCPRGCIVDNVHGVPHGWGTSNPHKFSLPRFSWGWAPFSRTSPWALLPSRLCHWLPFIPAPVCTAPSTELRFHSVWRHSTGYDPPLDWYLPHLSSCVSSC